MTELAPCCHKTRLLGAPCPLGRVCPYDDSPELRCRGCGSLVCWCGDEAYVDAPLTEGSLLPHLPVRTLPEPIPPHDPRYWKG
jgi:hypothetical protein